MGCTILERKIWFHKPLPKTKKRELWQILQEEWYNIDVHIFQNLVDNVPRRIAAVIESNGNPTFKLKNLSFIFFEKKNSVEFIYIN